MTSILPSRRPTRIIAIGASVGGPPALNTVLRALPADFPLPILCVQHIGSGFVRGLVDWLGTDCSLTVKVAEPGELPRPGTAYFAPESLHLVLDGHGRLATSAQAPVSGHRPSVTVTFKSVAAFYGRAAAGVLLTGMGEDGAEGLKTIADAGGLTIAQDEKTSVVFGMPGHAVAIGAARFVLPIGKIAESLLSHVMQGQEQF
jgi:two-component system, chemotaxis family, protein-glutamate methylesterase/glutaminase